MASTMATATATATATLVVSSVRSARSSTPRLMTERTTSSMSATTTTRMMRYLSTMESTTTTTAAAPSEGDSASRRYGNASCFFKPTPTLGLAAAAAAEAARAVIYRDCYFRTTGEQGRQKKHSIGITATNIQYHHPRCSWRFFSTTPDFVTSGGNPSNGVAHTTTTTSFETNAEAIAPGESLKASWKQMYDLLVEYHKEHRSTIVPDQRCGDENNSNNSNIIYLEIRKWVKAQRRQSRFLSPHQKTLLNNLNFVWDHQEALWLEKYERLRDYESKMPLEMSTTEISNIRSSDLESVFEKRYQKDPVLRRWVNAQRKKYRLETISVERVQLLEMVEGFVWDVKEARWFEMLRRLSLFAKNDPNGSCIVPQHYSPDPQLACWVSNQRHRKHQLSAERIKMLDSLGFVWDVRELQWMANYENFKAMYYFVGSTTSSGEAKETENTKTNNTDTNTNTNTNLEDDEEERKVVSKEEQQMIDWAIKQRRANRNGTLSAHRKHLLNKLSHPIDGSGFVWDPQGQNWMEMYHELEEFRAIHRHVMVPTRSTRYDDTDNESIDDDENAHGERILDNSTVSSAATPSSSTSLSSSSSPNRQLGVWVANQRRNFKKGTLSKKRQKLLDDIDFVWDAPEAMWNDQYQRLMDYQRQHLQKGKERSTSTLVPQHYPKDPQLAIWVKEQRQNRKNGILTAERLDLLETLGFVWDASSSPPLSPSLSPSP